MDQLFPQPPSSEVLVCSGCGHEHAIRWKTISSVLKRYEEGCEECGTELTTDDVDFEEDDRCRVCNEPVVDARWNYCSERCRDIANAVQRMFNWQVIREEVLERDDHTCQHCGISKELAKRAHWQTHEHIDELTEPLKDRGETDRWRTARRWLEERYGMPLWSPGMFEVDHIEPIDKGGHKFDERNLQTLCKGCHAEKTAEQNRVEEEPPEDRHITLENYQEAATDGGGDRVD